MTNAAKHTPAPWLKENHTVYALNNLGTNRFTTHIQGCGISTEEIEANAAFIIKAVNCHDSLVEALEGLVAQFEYMEASCKEEAALWNKARAAIAKAKGGAV